MAADKCSRCDEAATGWIRGYFILTGADLGFCGSHTEQFRGLHPFGPEVSASPSKKSRGKLGR